ncbi:hypothetical protein [Agarilytica rhodophyticola]|uniref:hypothetical protein n=1 Tax=Agarilytica rhodophyticola TaxID=1737490 RepID=UPI0013150FF8|nr:hypothetical protein [Agarilytica rhodophyticola]
MIEKVWSSEPTRRVKASNRGKNRAVRYPSKKMGVVIQAESFSLEFSGIQLKEFDADVFRYYYQLPSLDLYKSGNSSNLPAFLLCFSEFSSKQVYRLLSYSTSI